MDSVSDAAWLRIFANNPRLLLVAAPGQRSDPAIPAIGAA